MPTDFALQKSQCAHSSFALERPPTALTPRKSNCGLLLCERCKFPHVPEHNRQRRSSAGVLSSLSNRGDPCKTSHRLLRHSSKLAKPAKAGALASDTALPLRHFRRKLKR